jgi:hypothetical protein
MLLVPFDVEWLEANTCRELLKRVLTEHLDRPTALATAESVKLFCTRQEVVTETDLAARVEREMSNATSCIAQAVMVVVKEFSTLSFAFKITSRPTATPSSARVNPFEIMRQSQSGYTSLPPRLFHARMYANHIGYNALIDFLEENKLDWNSESALTVGKRFVYGMSRAFF